MKNKFNKRSAWTTFALVAVAIGSYLVYKYGYLVYQEYDYYTHYENVNGLQRSNPVLINGVRVGEISDIELSGKDKMVTVTMSINKKIPIPKGTIAKLASTGLLGNKKILLEPGNGPGILTHNDVLRGVYDTSIMDMSEQIEPIVESVKYILGTADKGFSNFNRRLDNGLVEKTQADAKRLENSLEKYKTQVAAINASADKVITTLHKFRKQSDEIAGGQDKMMNTIRSAEKSTASLAAEPIGEPINNLRVTVKKAQQKATEIEESEVAIKALNDDHNYKKATKALQNANNDMKDLKENPPGISLIGGN